MFEGSDVMLRVGAVVRKLVDRQSSLGKYWGMLHEGLSVNV